MHSHAMDDVLHPVLQQFYLSSSSHSSSVLKVPIVKSGRFRHCLFPLCFCQRNFNIDEALLRKQNTDDGFVYLSILMKLKL